MKNLASLQRKVRRSTSQPISSLRDVRAVLFDRDGTLIVDVPYNGDPALVTPVPDAQRALDLLRARGIALAVVTNQSGIARGKITRSQADDVNGRVKELLGPFGGFFVCPHGPDDGCRCRKPMPGLLLDAAAALGVPPEQCFVIGDKASDTAAATAAGMRSALVTADDSLLKIISG